MTVRLLVLLLAGCLLAGVAWCPDFDWMKFRVIEFERHWDPFVRDLFGCKKTGLMTPEICFRDQESQNFGEFNKAKKEAMVLFNLREEE